MPMSFDQTVIHFAAPTICGIKPANLFSVRKECFSVPEFTRWKKALAERGISADAVRSGRNIFLILVYNLHWLRKLLADSLVRAYMDGKGYADCPSARTTIVRLLGRLRDTSCFPHEVGIVLGYPVVDVMEFERCGGRNCKYCGCWKTYSDVESARCCQCRFRECSCMCRKWFDEGYPLSRIIEEYKKAVEAA